MTLFANPLQQFFSSSKVGHKASETEADKIIVYIESLINREDLVDDLVKKYEHTKTLPEEQRELNSIPIYIGLEAFIVKNKPLIVKQEFTKDALRGEIEKRFDITALGSSFRLIFLPEKEQNALLFERSVQELARYIINNIGLPRLTSAVASFNQVNNAKFFTTDEQGITFSGIESVLQTTSVDEIRGAFQALYKVLLAEITKSLGANFTDTIITTIFDDVRKTYDYDLISQFLDVLPEGVLQSERIRRLGRDELEGKIQSRTRELDEARKQVEQKLDLIKRQNNELAKTKQDLLMSLKEEKRLEEEIKKEKEQVEEKVKERTIELQKKTDELNNAMVSLQTSYQQTENERARLLASINNLSLGFIMTDKNDKIIALNQTTCRIIQCDENKFDTMQKLHDFVKSSVNLLEFYQKCKTEMMLQKISDVNINNVFVRIFFTPVMINTDCIGVVILIEDISEAKLLERSKDEFFAVASHELRTPLTAIRGFTSLILDNFQEQMNGEPKLASMVTNIHESSIRLIKIVNSFLDASKLEQGKVTFNLESFALVPLLESVVTELAPLAEEKHILLTFTHQESLPDVYADQEKIKQIAFNLIGNAIKFTEKGSVTVTMDKTDTQITVAVTDTGLGVSEEYRQLLFRKFQQAGERILTRDAATGSGMGLYISKLLIEAMKGSISIESTKLGEGSTFAFKIPIANK